MKKLFFVLIFLTIFIFILHTNIFASTYREEIKVGLYFGNSDVDSISLSSTKGLSIGYYNGNSFTPLLNDNNSSSVVIRKDDYFVRKSDGSLINYAPNEGIPYVGKLIGPYHIKVGDNYSDYETVQNIVSSSLSAGVEAYAVYENGWQVWVGFYTDTNTANHNIPNIAAKLGKVKLTIVPPSPTRTIILSSSLKVRMLFGGIVGKLQVKPKSNIISVNGRPYRGFIEAQRFYNSDLTVINVINIQDYLYGVVPAEIEADAPMEALKAQAVAARTFTYKSLKKYEYWDFDVCNTKYSQVYYGYSGERTSSSKAVDLTNNQMIYFDGKLAQTYYFSSSGGATANSKYVWGGVFPYLVSVPDEYESKTSYHYTWEKTYTPEEVKKKLFAMNVDIGDIISISAEEYTSSGRVYKLRISGTKGEQVYYAEDCRWVFDLYSQKYIIATGSNATVRDSSGNKVTITIDGRAVVTANGESSIPSSLSTYSILGAGNKSVTINTVSKDYVFTGSGWGHGVGMSQEGAKGMAKNGFNYVDILTHYFQGATIQ